MARNTKKSGMAPETSLFGDLDFMEDAAEAPEEEQRAQTDAETGMTAGGAEAAAAAEVEDTLGELAETESEESGAAPLVEAADDAPDGIDEDDACAEEEAPKAQVAAKGAAGGLMPHLDDIMTGSAEEDGQLTLARYASRAYLEYAMSVVKSRALPDVSDGQKPVQRRILIDMERMGIKAGAKAVKSARVVGDVLGKYHPHGDQSVYDAMVRMAQNFSLRYPLVDGEGNFGSRDGDSPAAMRYTEARLMPIAELLLSEVDTGAIDFTPNYDGNFQEPVMLPAKLPFVLLNGSSGIAVGMATNIPSHNLTEVAAACELLIDKPEATLDEVMAVLPAPDFPCGAQIISPKNVIRSIYKTGRGKIEVRARYHFEELARGQWQLVIDELPPGTSSQLVLKRIEEITNPTPSSKSKKDKKTVSAEALQAKAAMLALLDRVRDESGEDRPVRLVFEPKTSRIDRQEFVSALLSATALESSVPVSLVMLGIDGKPCVKPLLNIISEWIEFRLGAVRRRTAQRLEKVNDRIHVLEGRAMVLLNIDRVIEIIRNHDDPKAALMAEFGLTDRQTEDILEIRLRQLARLAAIAIEKEIAELTKEKQSLERILGSDSVLRRTVVREIHEAVKKFGDPRRTLIEEAAPMRAEQRVPDEPVTVVLSKKGFVRTRQGHDVNGNELSYKVGDAFDCAVRCRSVDDLTFLTDTGRSYTVKVSALPGGRGDGLPLSSFVDLDKNMTRFVGIFADRDEEEIVLATTDAQGFLCQVKDLKSAMRSGRNFVKLGDGEAVLPVITGTALRPYLACLSARGRLLVFPAAELRRLPNGGKGTAMMKLDPGEKLIDAAAADERGVIVSGTGRSGKPRETLIAKKAFADYLMHRARKGRVIEVTWRAERLASAAPDENAPADLGTPGGPTGLVIELEDESPRLL